MAKEMFSISNLTSSDGCFDLQFRKDTRHERTGSPTYYRWKLQFVITGPKENMPVMEKVKKELGCGDCSISKDQARFSVQNIVDIYETVVPYFKKNTLAENKKKDFQLWEKAVDIIYKNKGIYLSKWEKNDLKKLVEIHKAKTKYKQKPRSGKWMEMAQTLAK